MLIIACILGRGDEEGVSTQSTLKFAEKITVLQTLNTGLVKVR
jgi:hypothetical protein